MNETIAPILAAICLLVTAAPGEDAASAKYVVTTGKSVAEATAAVEKAAKEHRFGVLHVHDLQGTMRKKGVDFPNACRVLEICNPRHAAEVLNEDMDLSLLLPCRIAVYEKNGRTHIGMVRPSAMLGAFSGAADLKAIAAEVEDTTVKIIEAAK